jgi:AcrR family transcriptional regulator
MTKQDIINAAFRVWGRELYQTTSLTQVARDLGVTKPALYRHFKNKQSLLDAMFQHFFDDYTSYIKDDYEKALAAESQEECILIVTRIITRYYCQNLDAFVFSLFKVYGNQEVRTMGEHLSSRGLDMRRLIRRTENISIYPSIAQLILVTITFWIASFHRLCRANGEAVTGEEVNRVTAGIEEKIAHGLGLDKNRINALDFEALEARIAGMHREESENDKLLKAVASAVAEAGPWNASMDMVARRSGLSKSGLYAHFINKRDMLAQLFMTEFQQIVSWAEEGRKHAAGAEDQLYLTIIAIADYLRSKPEILMTADWIRTRKVDLGISEPPPEIFQVFLNIPLEGSGIKSADSPVGFAQWILFLIINILMRRPSGMEVQDVPYETFRTLFRFVTLGMKGFLL